MANPNRSGKSCGEDYLDGYLFHQAEAARDPGLVEWVVRKDYLED